MAAPAHEISKPNVHRAHIGRLNKRVRIEAGYMSQIRGKSRVRESGNSDSQRGRRMPSWPTGSYKDPDPSRKSKVRLATALAGLLAAPANGVNLHFFSADTAELLSSTFPLRTLTFSTAPVSAITTST